MLRTVKMNSGLWASRLDLLAQVADVHVDRARVAKLRVAPDELQQDLPRVHAAGVRDERLEQLELDVGEVDPLAAHVDVALGQVDVEAVDLETSFVAGASGLAAMSARRSWARTRLRNSRRLKRSLVM